ncbi:MAG: hypothetical protein HKM28_02075 [Flavobacteriaceae bacterium]|nr:hypothetical protein [Flavobacteriaceae bacterium]
MANQPILRNESSEVRWTLNVRSVHIVAYKLWIRASENDAWKVLIQGSNTDPVNDAGSFQAAKGSQFAYWMGIGSTTVKTDYDISLSLQQEDQLLVNGDREEKGPLDDDGVARADDILTFQLAAG